MGDVDPIKVAQGRTLGDPETIHFGLVPRTNRGIFAVNELPDLAERIQVSLLNVLEERDIQVRGYQLRLPLDLLLVASANPEDYTNRGRIITPLKDRFGAEIRTHYPLELDLEIALVRQEAELVASVPDHLIEVLARFARAVRESPSVDARSGVSARFAIAAAETVAASALRRSGLLGEDEAVARIGDTVSVTSTLRGKVEFESGEEGREVEILSHLLRTSTAETFRARLAGLDFSGFIELVAEGDIVETGELVPGRRGAAPGRHGAGAGQGAGTTRHRRRADPGRSRSRRRVRARRAAPDPAHVQGADRGGPHPLREQGVKLNRYGAWDGGPDPLAPPYDVRAAVDAVGRDVLEGRSLREALRDLLRRGPRAGRTRRPGGTRSTHAPGGDAPGRSRRRRDPRAAIARPGGRGGTRRARAAATTRIPDSLSPCWTILPRSTSRAVEELSDYQWASDEARGLYQQILDGLRQEVVEQRFQGMRDALSDPAAQQAAAEMMRDLNDLLERHARGEDMTDQFAEFMERHGDYFPENPETVDELVDILARRAAAGERLMRSLSPQQQQELASLMQQALGDGPLGQEMAAVSATTCVLCGPTWHGTDASRCVAMQPLGYGEAAGALEEIGELDELIDQLGQEHPGATLDDIDVDAVSRNLGRAAADDVRRLQELERELRATGLGHA